MIDMHVKLNQKNRRLYELTATLKKLLQILLWLFQLEICFLAVNSRSHCFRW